MPTSIVVSTNASWLKNLPTAACRLTAIGNSNQFLSLSLDDDGFAPRVLPATVLNATHLRCSTLAFLNGAYATLDITVDGTHYSMASDPIAVLPALEFAVGRRPYVTEQAGELVVKSSARLAGQKLRVSAWLAAGGQRLVDSSVDGGETVALPIDLSALPREVSDALVLSAALADGTQITKSRAFVRARPPPADYAGGVWQLDHRRRGMLANGEPFVALGWFNGPLNPLYRSEGRGDSAAWAAGPRPLQEARSLLVEWARRGHTLLRLGAPYDPARPSARQEAS